VVLDVKIWKIFFWKWADSWGGGGEWGFSWEV
jgi:hypothetical protein